jgi:hypothetical protein
LLVLFGLLGMTDLVLTWWLLRRPAGEFYEANPVAHWWLARYGWVGLAALKASSILLVAVLTALIARRQRHVAAGLLAFGCALTGGVVLYSVVLTLTGPHGEGFQEAERSERLQRDLHRAQTFLVALKRAGSDVAAGRSTLDEAAQRMATLKEAREPDRMRQVQRLFPDCTWRQGLAALVVRHACRACATDPPTAHRLARQLKGEFLARYGRPMPETALRV